MNKKIKALTKFLEINENDIEVNDYCKRIDEYTINLAGSV